MKSPLIIYFSREGCRLSNRRRGIFDILRCESALLVHLSGWEGDL
ncbi:hypothetical protein HMPREF9374_0341 [Desmospora sp. 8437]|nr:hypothetical protein HMPREF9374_0341 [Desmospora sp. 8437]